MLINIKYFDIVHLHQFGIFGIINFAQCEDGTCAFIVPLYTRFAVATFRYQD